MKYLQNGGLLLTKKFPSTFYANGEQIEKAKEMIMEIAADERFRICIKY